MAKLNRKVPSIKTHEGATAKHISPLAQLRRSVLSCMLWEKEFYEDGQEIAKRIAALVPQVEGREVANLAILARGDFKLRHVPLLLAREMARYETHKPYVAVTLEKIIQRPDELTEFLALYWKDGKQPLSGQVKKGLGRAFTKFTEYSLAKYNRDGAVKLRDVLFLTHAKPKSPEQEELWKRLIDSKLAIPDTWETNLSAGKDKKETWERLIAEKKLGGLATLRNLRNMKEAGVSKAAIRQAITEMDASRVLPYRFIAAAKYGQEFEPELEKTMFRSTADIAPLTGDTALLIDTSGSMTWAMSGKSDLTRLDAACGLAMLVRELCPNVEVFAFSDHFGAVAPRRGFALRDGIKQQPNGGTDLGKAIKTLAKYGPFDRVIVFTDEQSHTTVPDPIWDKSYIVNVASAKNGVGYGKWKHIDGFSEAIISFIQEFERAE